MIRVMILAPNLALRIGLREILRCANDIVVAGEASSPDELETMDTEADVFLMASASVHWFESNRFFSQIRAGQAVLLLSDDPEPGKALASWAGVWGILPPDANPQELAVGLRALHAGLTVLPPHLVKIIFHQSTLEDERSLEPLAEPLTAREGEVLGLLAQGLANKQIAIQLKISEHTVKFHVSSVYAKLGATNRTEAVRIGTLRGLITL